MPENSSQNPEDKVGQEEPQGEQQGEMGFFDHLEELRKRLLWAAIGITLGCIVSGFFIDTLMNKILLQPALQYSLKLQNLRPFGQPFLYFKLIFVIGIILSFPFTLYQLWLFVAPGLYEHEQSWARRITFFTSFCFLTGVAFAYYVMIPGMLSFTSNFGTKAIENNLDINEYFGFMTTTLLAAGLIFEMPMITYVLTKIGMVTPKFMRTYRRHAIIIILVVAAVLTPSPDPVNQLIFAVPLWILYEISIVISQFALKNKAATQQAA